MSLNGLPADFDEEVFIKYLDNAKELLNKAEVLAQDLYDQGYRKLAFVGCGAPNRIVSIIKFWVELKSSAKIENFLPAEFIDINPESVDEETIVIFGSYSGTTKETVEAATFSKQKGCLRLAITRFDDSPLGKHVDVDLNFGDTRLGDYSRFMISLAFTSSFFRAHESIDWSYHTPIISALSHLPTILADIVAKNETKVRQISEHYRDANSLFVVGHGPMYHTAYILAFCSFMEMQWIHATPIIGAEFFHGPFELVDGSFPVILLIGEDPTREQGIRIQQFGEAQNIDLIVFDTADFQLDGIRDDLRGLFGPIVLDAATRRLMDYFASIRGHDKSKRRYMGVIDY